MYKVKIYMYFDVIQFPTSDKRKEKTTTCI